MIKLTRSSYRESDIIQVHRNWIRCSDTPTDDVVENRCGGKSVDDAFLEFLLPRLNGKANEISQKVLLSRFEMVKRNFDGTDGSTGAHLTLPRGVRPASTFEDSMINGVLALTE